MTLKDFIELGKSLNTANKTDFCRFVSVGLSLTGLTLEEVASRFDTAPGTVSRWKNGHTAPTVFARKRIVRFFVDKAERLDRGAAAAADSFFPAGR